MSMTGRWLTTSAEQTEELALKFAGDLTPGDWVGLTGPLGAGKTVWARGMGRGMGILQQIVSPTFALVNVYEGRVRFCHLDLYRLHSPEELNDLGLEELADEQSIVVIEWATRLPAARFPFRWEININRPPGEENQREIIITEIAKREQR